MSIDNLFQGNKLNHVIGNKFTINIPYYKFTDGRINLDDELGVLGVSYVFTDSYGIKVPGVSRYRFNLKTNELHLIEPEYVIGGITSVVVTFHSDKLLRSAKLNRLLYRP